MGSVQGGHTTCAAQLVGGQYLPPAVPLPSGLLERLSMWRRTSQLHYPAVAPADIPTGSRNWFLLFTQVSCAVVQLCSTIDVAVYCCCFAS